MAIICLEGASAVGKTTTAKELAIAAYAYVIPEVAMLFEQPQLKEEKLLDWILERQVERWQVAQEKSKEYDLVILDGDHLKIWYSWIYGFQSISFDELGDYFRKLIINKEIGFPDAYFILTIAQDELRRRKEADETRLRRNFDKHLKLIKPQIHFFNSFESYKPGLVHFLEAISVKGNIQAINKTLSTLSNEHTYSVELFDFMMSWLRTNTPDSVNSRKAYDF